MDDIPEGLVEAVARALCRAEHDREDFWTYEVFMSGATAAILAQHAWYEEQNQRMSKFVEFQGPNPRD